MSQTADVLKPCDGRGYLGDPALIVYLLCGGNFGLNAQVLATYWQLANALNILAIELYMSGRHRCDVCVLSGNI